VGDDGEEEEIGGKAGLSRTADAVRCLSMGARLKAAPSQNKIRVKVKVKGVGQECPTHTSRLTMAMALTMIEVRGGAVW
jgi:hypothetical protein